MKKFLLLFESIIERYCLLNNLAFEMAMCLGFTELGKKKEFRSKKYMKRTQGAKLEKNEVL